MKLTIKQLLVFIISTSFVIHVSFAQSNLGLNIAENQTVLFGKDTITAGNKLQWHPSKAAFRAGRASAGEWNYGILGLFSAAFGRDTEARGNFSFAAGFANHAFSYGETSFGRYSLSGTNPDPDTWVGTDVLFEIGNGLNANNRSNALTVLKNGEVLIPSLAGSNNRVLEADADGRIVASTAATGQYAIGDFVQGGVVFWVSNNGDHCKVVSIYDMNNVEWSNITTAAANTSEINGAGNTVAIINQSGHDNSAAELCADLAYNDYDDWYLPSKLELDQIYTNRNLINPIAVAYGGESLTGFYWSSTEFSIDFAWGQFFANGSSAFFLKDRENKARAIRAF